MKLAWNGWRGAGAQGFGRPELRPLAIGVSGLARRFAVAEFLTNPGDPKIAYGWGLAVNAFVPVIGARSATDRGNALSLTGEFTTGTGTSDLYTGLTGGALFPLLPDPSGNITPPPLYRPNIDSGIVTYDANGNLKTIDWRAFVIGLQYYLPIGGGRVWVAATYSRLESANILALTPEASRGGVFIKQQYFDGSLFVTLTPAVQLGVVVPADAADLRGFAVQRRAPRGQEHAQRGGAALVLLARTLERNASSASHPLPRSAGGEGRGEGRPCERQRPRRADPIDSTASRSTGNSGRRSRRPVGRTPRRAP